MISLTSVPSMVACGFLAAAMISGVLYLLRPNQVKNPTQEKADCAARQALTAQQKNVPLSRL